MNFYNAHALLKPIIQAPSVHEGDYHRGDPVGVQAFNPLSIYRKNDITIHPLPTVSNIGVSRDMYRNLEKEGFTSSTGKQATGEGFGGEPCERITKDYHIKDIMDSDDEYERYMMRRLQRHNEKFGVGNISRVVNANANQGSNQGGNQGSSRNSKERYSQHSQHSQGRSIQRGLSGRRELFGIDKHDSSDDEDDVSLMKHTFMEALKIRAKAVTNFVNDHPAFKPWKSNWKLLKENLFDKNKLTFELLEQSDEDIAFVINKGEQVCFRLQDKKRIMPINIYQYVLYHEMAHMSTNELQHTPKFHELLNLLSLAAFELGFFDIRRFTKSLFTTNDLPIASKEHMQGEVIRGCEHMLEKHQNDMKVVNYYKGIIDYLMTI